MLKLFKLLDVNSVLKCKFDLIMKNSNESSEVHLICEVNHLFATDRNRSFQVDPFVKYENIHVWAVSWTHKARCK